MKIVTMSELRRNLFRLVDEAVATGEAIVVERKGARVVIRGEGKIATETQEEEDARWARFWAEPPRPGSWDFTVEEFNRASAEAWEWSEEPKLNR
jgi:hypothetical protein